MHRALPLLFLVLHLLALSSLVDLSLVFNFRSFSTEHIFVGWGNSHTQNPTWRTRVSLFVWVINLNLCDMGGPTSSYAPTSIALRIIDHTSSTTTSKKGYLQGELYLYCCDL
jgi:hypothetical protein